MPKDVWSLFPYPTLNRGEPQDGSIMPAHPECVSCPTRECVEGSRVFTGEIGTCRFGLNYLRVDDERLVTGIVVPDGPSMTQRLRKRVRHEPARHVRGAALRGAVQNAREMGPGIVEDFEIAKTEVFARLRQEPEVHHALAEQLRRDFSDNLHQSHDFLQLVKLVRGHAEALLHEKFPDLDPPDAADRLPAEGAIFYSTELMLAKMDAMVFLNEINVVHGDERTFQAYPMIHKYVRIYAWQANEKNLRLRLEGSSYSFCHYNTKAIGAVVQGLLDNLVKYAPADSNGAVTFQESESEIEVSFTSLGPRIDDDETENIFLPRYRARAAKTMENTGQGIGLATAKQISDALDLGLGVEQAVEADDRFPGRYRTRFFFTLRKARSH